MPPSPALRTAAVICTGAAALYSMPFLLHLSSRSSGPRIDSSQPLKQEAVRRGAFNNSGSLDAGPDPNWQNGRYVRPSRGRKADSATTNEREAEQ